MRTKNAKRPWPVPAALAVVALAAFLAFGLMATPGVQPALADDGGHVTVELDDHSDIDCHVHILGVDTTDNTCSVSGTSAIITFVGTHEEATSTDTNKTSYYVYYPVASGEDIQAYPPGVSYGDHDGDGDGTANTPSTFYTGSTGPNAVPVGISKFGYALIEIEAAKRGPSGVQAQLETLTVSGEIGKTITVYVYRNGPDIGNVPDAPETVSRQQLPNVTEQTPDGDEISVTYLGTPAVGTDGSDRNKVVDDDRQCLNGDNDVIDTVAMDADTGPCTGGDSVATLIQDPDESRSKLLVRTAGNMADPVALLDGKSKDHMLDGEETSATVYAIVQDKGSNHLTTADVTFRVTSMPTDVSASTRTEDVEVVGDDTEAGELDIASDVEGIEDEDAVAMRTISELPTTKGYRVMVEVSADGVSLGTIVLVRSGPLDDITALTCKVDDDNTATDDGCGAGQRPETVFNKEDEVIVKAKALDALDSAAAGVSISVVAAEDDDDVFDGVSPYAADEGVANITIADDADSGEYTLTIKAEQGSGDTKVTKMTTVNVIVTGVLDHYAIDGPASIQPGTSEIFSVEAQDSLNNRAEFGSKQSMKVAVSVEGPGKDFVSLSGLTAGELDLGTSGMASFRVRAASDAVGSRITIVVTPVGSGVADITEATKDVVIGMASTGEDEMVELMMPTGVTPRTFPGSGSINVSWTAGQGAEGHVVLLFTAAAAYVDIEYVTDIDTTSHTFRDVTPGDYYVVVASYQGSMYAYDYLGVDVTVR